MDNKADSEITRRLSPVGGTPRPAPPAYLVPTLPAPPPGPPAPWAHQGALLQAWLERQGLSHAALAECLECSRPAVGQWCAGVARPVFPRAVAIETAGGPQAWDWLTPGEKSCAIEGLNRLTQAIQNK